MVSPTNGVVAYYNNQVVLCSGRDTLLISDVLDPDTYDPLLKGFRTNTGSNDYIVAIHPYANRQIICFLRKSIYLGNLVLKSDGVSIDEVNSSLQLLTNEIGCSARMVLEVSSVAILSPINPAASSRASIRSSSDAVSNPSSTWQGAMTGCCSPMKLTLSDAPTSLRLHLLCGSIW